MELMSSLLLCAVVAFPPPALGQSTLQYAEYGNIRWNSSINFHQNPKHTNTLVGINPSIIKKKVNILSPFMEITCRHCAECMGSAVEDFKLNSRVITKFEEDDNSREELTTSNNEVERDKRESDVMFASQQDDIKIKTKRGKSKKNKVNKTVTVTKYNVNRQISAIKVKETQIAAEQDSDTPGSTTCQVYSVKKSYPCDTPESDLILAAARRKINKKTKKEKEKSTPTTSTTETSKFIGPAFRKRELDHSDIPENFMPSIEDLY